MSKKAIIIGAGQIGRGFLGQVLFNSGYKLVFCDVSKALVDEINRLKEYQIYTLGKEHAPQTVTGVHAVHFDSAEAADAFRDADIVVTACGAVNLENVSSLIAAGCRKRALAGNSAPLSIIACENMNDNSSTLRGHVYARLTEEDMAFVDACIAFPDCEVSRLVVPAAGLPPLAVKVEEYMEWIVDSGKAKGDLSSVAGIRLSPNIEAYIARKIFSLTGHAALGYMGYAAGHKTIWQSVYDYSIYSCIYNALAECAKAWSKKYGLPEDEFMEYSNLMMIRFADQRIQDPVTRPARDPMRKLAKSERFFGPALTAYEYGIFPEHILQGAKAACKYNNPEDKEALQLQQKIAEQGLAKTLSELTGLPQEHALIRYFEEV